jgi:hypothetical protein
MACTEGGLHSAGPGDSSGLIIVLVGVIPRYTR